MNKQKGKSVMKSIFKVVIILIFIAIAVGIISRVMREKKNKEYIQNYRSAVELYLHNKYRKQFIINPKYITSGGSPIPGRTYATFTYEVKERDESGCVFNVCIYPESQYNYKIMEIRDNYFWKSLHSEIRAWLQNSLSEATDSEYKFFIYSIYSMYTFDGNETENISVKKYFETSTVPVSFTINLIIPPTKVSYDEQQLKDALEDVIAEFYLKFPNSDVLMFVSQANTYEDFRRIDVNELENTPFYLYKEWVGLKNVAKINTLMEIRLKSKKE